MKMCLNKKVIGGLAVVALAVLLIAPNLLGAVLPLLVVAICPLSMLAMMGAMRSGGKSCAAGSSESTDDELAQLRNEVERLRAERGQASPPVARPADAPIPAPRLIADGRAEGGLSWKH